METRRRQLTRQSDDVAVSAVRILSLVKISVIIIAFAAARETTAVIVADASRVVLTRGVGVLGVVLQFGKFGHENVVIDERNVWIGLIICAVFRAQLALTRSRAVVQQRLMAMHIAIRNSHVCRKADVEHVAPFLAS